MKAVIQRVSFASVTVDENLVGRIGKGVLVLLGVEKGDDESRADWLAEKIAGLRIFADEEGKMNLALADVGGRSWRFPSSHWRAIATRGGALPLTRRLRRKRANGCTTISRGRSNASACRCRPASSRPT